MEKGFRPFSFQPPEKGVQAFSVLAAGKGVQAFFISAAGKRGSGLFGFGCRKKGFRPFRFWLPEKGVQALLKLYGKPSGTPLSFIKLPHHRHASRGWPSLNEFIVKPY